MSDALLRIAQEVDLLPENIAQIETYAPANIAVFDSENKPRKQSDVLIDIGMTHELFHDETRKAYACVGLAVFEIDSISYRDILAEKYFDLTGKGCNRNALGDAITTISSRAKFRGDCRRVWLRVAGNDNRVVIDTGDTEHTLIEITKNGWKLIASEDRPMFRRTNGTAALPAPATQPDFFRIWKYLTVTEENRPLVAGFLLGALRPFGPYPALHLSGEQGTGKSTQARVLRRLIDPSASPLRPPPREVRDLLVGALNGWLLCIDNLSGITSELSDSLCRLSTGGAISERALYSNTDEILIEIQRPIIVNGIEDLATRPDLAERGIHIELDPITTRRTEAEFWRSFEEDAPHIFAALLKGLAASIRNHKNIKLGELPRMADFAIWAAAGIEPLGFTAEEFMSAYRANIAHGQTAGLQGSPVGEAIVQLMATNKTWSGTRRELLTILNRISDDSTIRGQSWPKSPSGITGALRRLAPALRSNGISVDRDRNRDQRLVVLRKMANKPSPLPQNDGCDSGDGINPTLHNEINRPANLFEGSEDGSIDGEVF